MIIYGYAKSYHYAGDGTMMVKVRIPNIHGPYKQIDYKGQRIRNYVKDEDLPEYISLQLPYTPTDGDVVALMSINEKSTDFIVIGLTGGHYQQNQTDLANGNLGY